MTYQFAIGTVALGSIYCLVIMGMVVLFRATKTISFTQGSMMALGAFLFYTLQQHQPFILALAESMLVVGVVGGAAYHVLFRRLAGSEHFVVIIATLGLNVLLIVAINAIWGTSARFLPIARPVRLPGTHLVVTSVELLTFGLAVGLTIVLVLTIQKTRTGLRMRAVADQPLLAAYMAINVDWISTLAWVVSAMTAAAAGVCLGLGQGFDVPTITPVGYVAFPAMLLGGLDSIRGALVGGMALALIQNTITLYWGGQWPVVGGYAVLLVVLLIRPSGMFGSKSLIRV